VACFPPSDPLAFLIQIVCLAGEDLSARAMPFVELFLKCDDPAVLKRAFKCFGILSLKFGPCELSSIVLQHAIKFLSSSDISLVEGFLEILSLVDPAPVCLFTLVFELLIATDSISIVRHCSSFFYRHPPDDVDRPRLCRALLQRARGEEYAAERCAAKAVARLYGDPGEIDLAVVTLCAKYAATERDCLRAVYAVCREHWRDVPTFLADAAEETAAALRDAAEAFEGDESGMALELLALLE
jgi:hypothetical protein